MEAAIGVLAAIVVLIVRRRRRRARSQAATEGLVGLLGQRPERAGRYNQGPYKGRWL